MHENRYADSEKLLREDLEISRRVKGPDDPDTLSMTYNVAVILGRERRFPEAENLLRRRSKMNAGCWGPSTPKR